MDVQLCVSEPSVNMFAVRDEVMIKKLCIFFKNGKVGRSASI